SGPVRHGPREWEKPRGPLSIAKACPSFRTGGLETSSSEGNPIVLGRPGHMRDALGGIAEEDAVGSTRPPIPAGLSALTDRLARRLRVSEPAERFQELATSALRDALDVEAVAWVPGRSREPVVVAGGVEGLSAESYRGMLSGPRDG